MYTTRARNWKKYFQAHFCDFLHKMLCYSPEISYLCAIILIETLMSYSEMAQLELMNAAANVTSQEDLDALRLTLSLFFAERAQKAIDKMWDEGTFDQKKLDELRGQHLRTPYK